jgi:S1-C subfamily serine protease
VFGHPQGQVPVELSPARVVRRVTATLPDIYGENRAPRELLLLASLLEPGDSGGALVDTSGTVVGVAFAVSTVFRGTAFAVPSEDLASALAQPRTGPVSTGPCLV